MKALLLLFLGAHLLTVSPIAAQQPLSDSVKKKGLTQAHFFAETAPLQLTLTGDFRQLKRKKQKGVYLPVTATVILPGGEKVTEPALMAARGEFRRLNCAMPSLMVNFRTGTAGKLAGLKRLKMVCGCRTGGYAEDLVLKEYLTYRIYNQLSDLSFRVRLAQVTYVDMAGAEKTHTQYAFFVEDVDAMAKRNASMEYVKKINSSAATNRHQLTLVCMFQYMIGNLDWSVPNLHNIKLVQPRSDTLSQPYAVPYDFDFCGLVNAAYAFPQEEFQAFQIEKVTDRMYRGFPASQAMVESLLQLFLEKKESIYTLISGFELLGKSERDGMLNFLDGFYKTAGNQQDVRAIFVEASRKN